jgi:hypothetical protein
MKSFARLVCLLLLAVALVFCNGGLNRDLAAFMGQRVSLPAGLPAYLNGKETPPSEQRRDEIKFVVWYDSSGCSSCRLKELWQWEEYATYSRDAGIDFRVVLSPNRENILSAKMAIGSQKPPFFVYTDNDGKMYELDPKMPDNVALHVFLLNKDERVVLAGNPLYNPKLWELYKSTITELVENDGTLDQ